MHQQLSILLTSVKQISSKQKFKKIVDKNRKVNNLNF